MMIVMVVISAMTGNNRRQNIGYMKWMQIESKHSNVYILPKVRQVATKQID